MTAQDMLDLVIAYEAYVQLKDALGVSDIAFGYSDGILGALSRIEDVIRNHSVVDDCAEILESEISAREKVGRLMGNHSS